MLIQYQNTYEEFTDASAALARRKKKNGRLGVVFIVTLVVYIAAMTWLADSLSHPESSIADFHLAFPFILLGAFILVFVLINRAVVGKFGALTWRAVLGCFLLLIVLGWFFLVELLNAKGSQQGGPAATRMLLLPHATWLFFGLWLFIATIASPRRRLRKLWEGQPSFHRAKTADISADGIVITDPVVRHDYRWEAFIGWHETKSLIVLFLSTYQFLFLPKRAFAFQGELDAMRELMKLIPTSAASAFLTAASTAPPLLPAISERGDSSTASKR